MHKLAARLALSDATRSLRTGFDDLGCHAVPTLRRLNTCVECRWLKLSYCFVSDLCTLGARKARTLHELEVTDINKVKLRVRIYD